MLVALTGTPGTGKSSVAGELERRGYFVLPLDRFAEEHKLVSGFDAARGTREIDVEALDREIRVPTKLGFLVAHYAHRLSVNLAIVLRCHPRVLADRLRARGWAEAKVRENVEAEAIDAITQEAVARLPFVYEIDTTSTTPEAVAGGVPQVPPGKVAGGGAGDLDWRDEGVSWQLTTIAPPRARASPPTPPPARVSSPTPPPPR